MPPSEVRSPRSPSLPTTAPAALSRTRGGDPWGRPIYAGARSQESAGRAKGDGPDQRLSLAKVTDSAPGESIELTGQTRTISGNECRHANFICDANEPVGSGVDLGRSTSNCLDG